MSYIYILCNRNENAQLEYRVRQVSSLFKYPFTEAGIKRLDGELFATATMFPSEFDARRYAIQLVTANRGLEEALYGFWVQPVLERNWPFVPHPEFVHVR